VSCGYAEAERMKEEANGFSSASATSRRDEYRHESTTTTTTTRGGGGGGAGGVNLAKLTGAIQTGWKDKYGEKSQWEENGQVVGAGREREEFAALGDDASPGNGKEKRGKR
jgi:hypothetical protein